MKMHSVRVPPITKLGVLSISALLAACGGGGGSTFLPTGAQTTPTTTATTPASTTPTTPKSFAERCASLAGQAVGTGTIVSTKLLDASASQPQTCAAQGQIVSSSTSTISFQLDLPTDGAWNKKFLQIGGGGYDGVVSTIEAVGNLPDGVSPRLKGYAIVGSDSGHQGSNLSMAFALNNPVGFDNFAFNNHPLVYAAALDGIKAMYSAAPEKKYFWGASTGGREALLQAQRYPQNYDGIVAGMPVVDYSNVNQKAIQVAQLAYANNGAGWLSPAKVQTFANAELSACDALDGLADNLILNWQACHFDPQVLRCAGGADTGDTCLSDAQLATVAAMRTRTTLAVPLANGITSSPAYGIGGEAAPSGWTTFHFGATANPPGQGLGTLLASEWLKYAVASDANASIFSYVPGTFAAQWLSTSQAVNTTNPDLSAFNARGGKLVLWHGSSDALVPPGFSIDYYSSVVAKFGQTSVDSFVRFFVVGSMGHGSGGASVFDSLGSLESWVEKGVAPDAMTASTPQGSLFRPVCRFPYWPKYNGSGAANSASSFTCSAI